MQKKTLTIINKLGLHARAANKFARLASQFESHICMKRQHREANGKSIMNVMLLAACKGTDIELIIDGADEIIAMDKLRQLIQSGFGEEE